MMKNYKIKIFLYVLISIVFFNNLFAQSVKEPSPAEKKLLHKTISIIQSVLDQFGNNDWSLDQDWYNGDPFVPADDDGTGPIGLDQNFERDYKVTENSDRFNNIILPLYKKSEQLTDRMVAQLKKLENDTSAEAVKKYGKKSPLSDSLDTINNKLEELSELHVYAYINNLYVAGKPVKGIDIPGAAMVTKFNRGHFTPDFFKSYYIAFGNWKSAKWSDSQKVYYFKFKDTPKSSVQNIVIIMTGAQDRMKELMHKIDWDVLNNALTN
jgi:hypothetical protein